MVKIVVLVALSLVILVYALAPKRPNGAPKLLTLAVWGLLFGEVFPKWAQATLSLVIVAAAFVAWMRLETYSRRGNILVPLAIAIYVYYFLLLVLHPNVPSLGVGLLGIRQSVLALGGIVLGCVVPTAKLRGTLEMIVLALLASSLTSIVLYVQFPGVEQSIVVRDADEFTAFYGGTPRLQGLFAGPFHAALAGLLLVGGSISLMTARRRPQLLSALALGVGCVLIALTAVRTAYVAVVLMFFIAAMIGRARNRIAKLLGASVITALAVALLRVGNNAALGSFDEVSSDRRLLNRLAGYERAQDLVVASPWFGWGPGAAGDTLGRFFVGGEHVTPHNLLIKIAVEGGLLGLLFWIALLFAWWRSIPRSGSHRTTGILSLTALASLGLTGSAVDALPLSLISFIMIGMSSGVSKPSSSVSTAPVIPYTRRSPALRGVGDP